MPVPRLAVERRGPQRLHPVRGRDPTAAAGCATYPVVERNESIYIWHDVEGREPFFDAPDVFAELRRRQQRRRLLPAAAACSSRGLELHPQYVLENGVDFAHFKFVHKTPIVPVFTRHDFAEPVSYVDFTITFEGDDGPVDRGRQQRRRGDQRRARHRGDQELGDDRQPHHLGDHARSTTRTSDVRFIVYIGRTPGKDDRTRAEAKAEEFGAGGHPRSSRQDIHIWSHQRYSDPPALSRVRVRGLHRDPQVGHAVLPRRPRRQRRGPGRVNQREGLRSMTSSAPIRVFQVATGNVGTEMIKRIGHAPRPRAGRPALLLAGQDRPRRRRDRRARPDRRDRHRHGRGDHRRRARLRDLPRRLPRRGPLRAGPRGRHQHRHHRRLDHRPPPRRQPPAPVGQAGDAR